MIRVSKAWCRHTTERRLVEASQGDTLLQSGCGVVAAGRLLHVVEPLPQHLTQLLTLRFQLRLILLQTANRLGFNQSYSLKQQTDLGSTNHIP